MGLAQMSQFSGGAGIDVFDGRDWCTAIALLLANFTDSNVAFPHDFHRNNDFMDCSKNVAFE